MESPKPENGGDKTRGESGFLGNVELIVKLAAAGLGLVAAMGFPAVYLHFSRFGIPAHFASYDHVLRAGVLPACLLVLAGFYLFWGIREFRSGRGSIFPIVPMILFMPLVICVLVVLMVGLIAYLLLITWVVLWILVQILSAFSSVTVANKTLLYFAGVVLILGSILYSLISYLLSRKNNNGSSVRGVLKRRFQRRTQSDGAAQVAQPDQSEKNGESQAKTGDDSFPWAVLLFVPVMFIGFLYVMKGLLYIWNPALSPLLSHRFILIFGSVCALIYAAFMVLVQCIDWMSSTEKTKRLKGYILVAGIVTTVFLGSVFAYSYSLYPRITRGLGGGRPERIVFWIAKEDLPADLQRRISKANFVSDGETIRCENVYLIFDDPATLIIADSANPPTSGAILPRDKIKAISW